MFPYHYLGIYICYLVHLTSGLQSCYDLKGTDAPSGIYHITPDPERPPITVQCDNEHDGGGWTIIQRRTDPPPKPCSRQDFSLMWNDYEEGFGNVEYDHWLGLKNMMDLTKPDSSIIINITDWNDTSYYAQYNWFRVLGPEYNYTVTISSLNPSSTIEVDALSSMDSRPFSTMDRDSTSDSCPFTFMGGWWYGDCPMDEEQCSTSNWTNLNGVYDPDGNQGYHSRFGMGINFGPLRGCNYSFKSVEMKVRQLDHEGEPEPPEPLPDPLIPNPHTCRMQSGRDMSRLKSELRTKELDKELVLDSCYDLMETGAPSGVYEIAPDPKAPSFLAYCDMDYDDGGWTVIQRRGATAPPAPCKRQNFSLPFKDYEEGFGNPDYDFWLGLKKIVALTKPDSYFVINLTDWNGTNYFARYTWFRVLGPEHNYELAISSYDQSSNASVDVMSSFDRKPFSTYDKDNTTKNCSGVFKGGWWYNSCYADATECSKNPWVNLNGQYDPDGKEGAHQQFGIGINFSPLRGCLWSFKQVELKIRQHNEEGGPDPPEEVPLRAKPPPLQCISEGQSGRVMSRGNSEQGTTNDDEDLASSGKIRSCYDLKGSGAPSGTYEIYPNRKAPPVLVQCDNQYDGGGWTVIQRRTDTPTKACPKQDFSLLWKDYEDGFGHVEYSYWLGLKNIFALTKPDSSIIVNITDWNDTSYYVQYNWFRVLGHEYNYTVTISSLNPSSTIEVDALSSMDRKPFSTSDRDSSRGSCPSKFQGGWWYGGCPKDEKQCSSSNWTNFNGVYDPDGKQGYHSKFGIGINFSPLRGCNYSFKSVEIKVRQLDHEGNPEPPEPLPSIVKPPPLPCISEGQSGRVMSRGNSERGTAGDHDDLASSGKIRSCYDLKDSGAPSGIYEIYPNPKGPPVLVQCDNEHEDGGWTVIQRRVDPPPHPCTRQNFSLPWKDYEEGFGNVQYDYWLGLKNMKALTTPDSAVIINITDWNDTSYHVEYNWFRVLGPEYNYEATISSNNPSGSTIEVDALNVSNGQPFSTSDRDNSSGGCARVFKGGWWYKYCYDNEKDCSSNPFVNLNGVYDPDGKHGPHSQFGVGINFSPFRDCKWSFKWVEMKVRQHDHEGEPETPEPLPTPVKPPPLSCQPTTPLTSGQEGRGMISKPMGRSFTKSDDLNRIESCYHLKGTGAPSGIYEISPSTNSSSVLVHCDMDYDGGGWTVIQRRMDAAPDNCKREDFYRSMKDYEEGFGHISYDHWLGLKYMSVLTQKDTELIVNLTDWDGKSYQSRYSTFGVLGPDKGYQLSLKGFHGSSAINVDMMREMNGKGFSTYDKEANPSDCAKTFRSGGWFPDCPKTEEKCAAGNWVNLNGHYDPDGKHGPHRDFGIGINFSPLKGCKYSFKFVEMKIRRAKDQGSPKPPAVIPKPVGHPPPYICGNHHGQSGRAMSTAFKDISSSGKIRSCYDLKDTEAPSGIYEIYPNPYGPPVLVKCDNEHDEGGWTVIQRRADAPPAPCNRQNFSLPWKDYEEGFGNVQYDHWLGLKNIFALTKPDSELIINITDWNDTSYYAEYKWFRVSGPEDNYEVAISSLSPSFSTIEVDALSHLDGKPFSTYDKDNSGAECPTKFKGGWWYNQCYKDETECSSKPWVNLNGIYDPDLKHGPHSEFGVGINFSPLRDCKWSFKWVEMKVRQHDHEGKPETTEPLPTPLNPPPLSCQPTTPPPSNQQGRGMISKPMGRSAMKTDNRSRIRSCYHLKGTGARSGIYEISPFRNSTPVLVHCDMDYDGGGWTVIQRRTDAAPVNCRREDFYRSMKDYEEGFGHVNFDYWLGLTYMRVLTRKDTELVLNLTDWDGKSYNARYQTFKVLGKDKGYEVGLSGYHNISTINVDVMREVNRKKFSAYDNEANPSQCAKRFRSGWWFSDCPKDEKQCSVGKWSNLNGVYDPDGKHGPHRDFGIGINFSPLKDCKHSFKWVELKIRRGKEAGPPKPPKVIPKPIEHPPPYSCGHVEKQVGRVISKSESQTEALKTGKIRSCYDLKGTVARTGIYEIYPNPDGPPFLVHCDMDYDHGGWTVIQRRTDSPPAPCSRQNFSLPWKDYEEGFGNLKYDFWLGLKHIAALTKPLSAVVINITDWDGSIHHAQYNWFSVMGPEQDYEMSIYSYNPQESTIMVDAMSSQWHGGQAFSTFDKDNSGSDCANKFKGGWWYSSCHTDGQQCSSNKWVNLNGVYDPDGKHGQHSQFGIGINYSPLKDCNWSFKSVEIKVRQNDQEGEPQTPHPVPTPVTPPPLHCLPPTSSGKQKGRGMTTKKKMGRAMSSSSGTEPDDPDSEIKYCFDLKGTKAPSGIYKIKPYNTLSPIYVYCDMDYDGGGWTVIQRRTDAPPAPCKRQSFNLGWTDYEDGFGHVNYDYWVGLNYLKWIAKSDQHLIINVTDWEGKSNHAFYEKFVILGKAANYKLTLLAFEPGKSTIKQDVLAGMNAQIFSTNDKEASYSKCSTAFHGGWWYPPCPTNQQQCPQTFWANLNGLYDPDDKKGPHLEYGVGINVSPLRECNYSFKWAEMRVRKASGSPKNPKVVPKPLEKPPLMDCEIPTTTTTTTTTTTPATTTTTTTPAPLTTTTQKPVDPTTTKKPGDGTTTKKPGDTTTTKNPGDTTTTKKPGDTTTTKKPGDTTTTKKPGDTTTTPKPGVTTTTKKPGGTTTTTAKPPGDGDGGGDGGSHDADARSRRRRPFLYDGRVVHYGPYVINPDFFYGRPHGIITRLDG